MAAPTAKKARDLNAEIAFLTRTLKAPTLRESVDRLAERARAETWTHEEFLVACLQREVAARDSHGGEGRIRAARFPARKSLEEFDFDHARGLKRDTVAHLGTLDFIAEKGNIVFLGPAPARPTSRPASSRVLMCPMCALRGLIGGAPPCLAQRNPRIFRSQSNEVPHAVGVIW
jgi:hypothetical protein